MPAKSFQQPRSAIVVVKAAQAHALQLEIIDVP